MEIADFLTSDYFILARISQGHLINNSRHPKQIFLSSSLGHTGRSNICLILGCLLPQTLRDICYQYCPCQFFLATDIHFYMNMEWIQTTLSRKLLGAHLFCVQDPRTYSPRHSWCAITTNSAFMRANCSPQSQLRSRLMGLAPPYGLATLCRLHCSMCVAPVIRAMLTWRRPHFLLK